MNIVLWRFLLSTALCRFILVIEMAGLREQKKEGSASLTPSLRELATIPQKDDMRK